MPTFIDPGVAAGSGYASANYHGSYEEWLYRASRSMAERYMAGDQGMLDSLSGATGSIGQPSRADFGSSGGGKTGTISYQTYDFFENYLRAHGSSDSYITSSFGAPPSSRATWDDVEAKYNGTFADKAKEAGLDRASTEKIAAGHDAASIATANIGAAASNYAADRGLEGVRLRVGADISIATMEDATRRYIAEGDWGVQKYVAELNNTGAMDRLKLELGQRDKELAQRAIEAQNQHHEAMVGLALEVAKYDAELGSQPRNWLAYASWLGNRGMVINGLNLATVANMMPENQVSPQEMASSGIPGASVAAVQQASTAAAAAGVNRDGTAANGTGVIGDASKAMTPGAAESAQTTTATTQQQSAQQQTQQQQPMNVAGIDLNSTDYAGIAKKLLGITGNDGGAPTTQQLQSAYDATGKGPGFGAWQGATTNRLGMTVNPMGQKEDYRQFSNLLPSQQDMRVAAAGSVGKYEPDFVKEMQRSRPKGGVSGVAAYG